MASNRIVTHEGRTHVVWLDQDDRVRVRSYSRKGSRWGRPVAVAEGRRHVQAALAMDPGGYLHLLVESRDDPLRHLVGAAPNAAARWRSRSLLGEARAAAPCLVSDRRGTLHACYRESAADADGAMLVYRNKPEDGDWSAPLALVRARGRATGGASCTGSLHAAANGMLVLAYRVDQGADGTPDESTGTACGVMWSHDGGRSWDHHHRKLSLPVEPAPGDAAAPGGPTFDESAETRLGNVVCDTSGAPYLTLNRRSDAGQETFLYRWWNGHWDVVPLLPAVQALVTDAAMPDCCALSIADDDVLYAATTVRRSGGASAGRTSEIVLLTSRDLGETFTAHGVSGPLPGARCSDLTLERATGCNEVASPHLAYALPGDGAGPGKATELRCVPLQPVARREERAAREKVAVMEHVIGLQLTEAQRHEMQRMADVGRRHYRRLRAFATGNEVEPPLCFVPGDAPAAGDEQIPFALSSAEPIARPGTDDDLAFLPITVLARLIQAREVSPVELTRLYLARLERYGPELHCVVTRTDELALAQAEAAEREIMAGRCRGPLHGIPWGAKDLLATRGVATTWGATPFKEQVIDRDATVVTRLREAGAILVAKLSLGALATGPRWFGGMTRNPWSPEESSAGSSAGPGAATAAGLVGFSIGSETGGSIVYPSSTCGIVGLRPTYGRVSRHGAMALSWTMDKLGPMCRGVEDCAAVFDAIRGPDGKDRSVVDAPFDWKPQTALRELRIGYLERELAAIKNPRVQAATAAALDVLRSLGADLRAVDTAEMPEYPWQTLRMILTVEAAAAFDDATRSGELDVMQTEDESPWPAVFRRFRLVSAVEYLRAQQVRARLMRDVAQLLAPWDVVLAPVDDDVVTMLNLTGHPEVVVPCGFVDGKPCGLRFIGNLYEEATVLAVARAYEQATDWHLRHPRLDSADAEE